MEYGISQFATGPWCLESQDSVYVECMNQKGSTNEKGLLAATFDPWISAWHVSDCSAPDRQRQRGEGVCSQQKDILVIGNGCKGTDCLNERSSTASVTIVFGFFCVDHEEPETSTQRLCLEECH